MATRDRGGGASTLLRTRAALWLVTLVAVLSVVTGIATIQVEVTGPLAGLLPRAVGEAVGFTGALTGFVLLVAAAGLRRRLRAAWLLAAVLLPLTTLQGVALLGKGFLSLPLIALSVLALPAVLLNRGVFNRRFDLSPTQIAAIAAIVGAQAYGTVGAYALRDHFTGIATVTDAFWFTIVTASTVGYGDITPTDAEGKLFATSVLLLSVASFAVVLGTVLGPAIESRLSHALGHMSDAQLDLLDDHLIVVGIGDLTAPIIEELAETDEQFVVISRHADRAAELRDRGFEVLTADPSDEEPLRRAGIERAQALVAATNDDAQDALAILTARELNRDLNIVAAATERENVKKLRRAGADAVLSPASIGGHLLVQSALGQRGMEEVADQILTVEEADDLETSSER